MQQATLKMPLKPTRSKVLNSFIPASCFLRLMNRPGNDYPTFFFRLLAGSPVVHVDLVGANTTLPTRNLPQSLGSLSTRSIETSKDDTLSKRGLGGFWDWLFPHHSGSGTFGKVPIAGQIAEWDYVGRNSDGDAQNNGYNAVEVSRIGEETSRLV